MLCTNQTQHCTHNAVIKSCSIFKSRVSCTSLAKVLPVECIILWLQESVEELFVSFLYNTALQTGWKKQVFLSLACCDDCVCHKRRELLCVFQLMPTSESVILALTHSLSMVVSKSISSCTFEANCDLLSAEPIKNTQRLIIMSQRRRDLSSPGLLPPPLMLLTNWKSMQLDQWTSQPRGWTNNFTTSGANTMNWQLYLSDTRAIK